MDSPDLSGGLVGRYRLHRLIGRGGAAQVYHASQEGTGLEVALKVLDPTLAARPGFMESFEDQASRVSVLGHPGIVRFYEFGVRDGIHYISMQLVRGGTLRDLLARGPLEPGIAWRITRTVADALHQAHQTGVIHRDLKPTNVLIDADGSALVSDFGLARTSYGFAVGTPGYMAPEQAMGSEVGSRADVYALGVLVFEMLCGSRLYDAETTLDLILTTVEAAIPAASSRNPELPGELDLVLSRALAKNPAERQPTTLELLGDLGRVRIGRPPPGGEARPQVEIATEAYKGAFVPAGMAAGNGAGQEDEAAYRQAESQLLAIFGNALTAGVAVDESSFIVGWNQKAEDTFGWTREEIIGRSLSSTLVPPQYRAAHERGFKNYLETGEGPVLGQVIEITALHKDGREFPIELSISPAARSARKALFVGFIRDLTQERRLRQMAEAHVALAAALEAAPSLEEGGYGILDAIGSNLEWKAGALWLVDGSPHGLRFSRFWKAEGFECPGFEQATREAAAFKKDTDLPGRVWSGGDPVWIADVLADDLPRTLVALRAGLRCAVGVPILQTGEVVGVLEFFGEQVQSEDDELLTRLYDIGRRVGRRYRSEPDRRAASIESF